MIDAKAAYIDIPLDFMSSWNDGAYALPREQSGIVNVVSCWSRPGFLQVGRGDEALITRYTQGAYTIKLASRFEAMRISKCDLKLTFLASAMIDAYGKPTDPACREGRRRERCDGRRPARSKGWPTTSSSLYGLCAQCEARNGDHHHVGRHGLQHGRRALLPRRHRARSRGRAPQRPSADDPVKSDISAVRAMKGAEAVTISDNYYIQGRVVAVDNVPAGCFAVQDADAGIFVELADHGLAVGDQVEVVVKDARLAVDADGLLVVTPTAADKVTKTAAASEVPAARPSRWPN